jgi:formate dehydrogenase major subunit
MTQSWIDIKNSDVIMVCGSNPAENHPVSFKWVTKAMENGAKLIVVDPRFTRTASKADIFAHLRPGTDIAFFGGIINYIITNKMYHEDYIKSYSNASYLINPGYSFKDGLFSGYNDKDRKYVTDSWSYQTNDAGATIKDATLQDPACVFQLMKQHYSRYTPEIVAKTCGIPQAKFQEIAKTFAATGAKDKAGTLLYAMGLTQHTVGVQNIRAFSIIQILLGNMGIAGGGINALRGESNVQGSTDFGLLAGSLPGYNNLPDAAKHPTLAKYKESEVTKTGFTQNRAKWLISMLKAWWGDNASADNDFAYHYLPKNGAGFQKSGYTWIALFEAMYAKQIKGLLCWGQNPAVSGPNSNLETAALEKLEWMMVADLWKTETAEFWKRPGVKPENIKTEVFLLPAALSYEKQGSITNSGRLIQWRYKATDAPDKAKDDLWMVDTLYKEIKALYQGDPNAKFPAPILNLNWDYGQEPDSKMVAKEINGYTVADKKQLASFAKLADDGSTGCGNWIYSGYFVGDGPADNKAAARDTKADPGGLGLYPGWGYSWPLNRKIIYNRCSCDTAGNPWNPQKVLVQWDGAKWITNDVADFGAKDAATGNPITPDKTASAPYIMLAEGQARIFVPKGAIKDGPFPEQYEPVESVIKNPLSAQQINPAAKIWGADKDKLTAFGSKICPIIAITYRVTEHWQTGSMTRNLPWLTELMPEMFVEISPVLAERKQIAHGDWVTVASARGTVSARAIVTERLQGFKLCTGEPEVAGMPFHYGYTGLVTGGPDEDKNYSVNQLSPHVAEPNTGMPEYKTFLVDVRKAVT